MIRIWAFDDTREAYDACQCREEIASGDLLLILSEGVVAVADTWPVAVTVQGGCLHHWKPGGWQGAKPVLLRGAAKAMQVARQLRFPVARELDLTPLENAAWTAAAYPAAELEG